MSEQTKPKLNKEKIVIFGATGGTGLELVKQSLGMGYDVSVFIHRSADSLGDLIDEITMFHGDVKDYEAVQQAIKGSYAVLVALGTMPGKTDMVLSKGTANIVRAMTENNVRRLVVETGAALVDDKKSLPAMWRFTSSMPLMVNMFDDKRKQELAVKNSDLDWVIVRPVNLINGEQTNKYVVNEKVKSGMAFKISRSDVAQFMLQQIDDDGWVHKPVVISY